MHIDEIMMINEATPEGIDVITISQYVASFLADHAKYGRAYDIEHMEDKQPLPELRTEAAYSMLYDYRLMFLITKGYKTKRARTVGAYHSADGLIWVDQRALRNFNLLVSILAHEIQHALDDIRSDGKALPPFAPEYTRKEYLSRPQEINARFSQAMYDIVDLQSDHILSKGEPWDRKKSIEMINKILKKHLLVRSLFPDNPRGQKAYNRIISRAHTFNDNVKNIIRVSDGAGKRSLIDRIKLLIRSYLPI